MRYKAALTEVKSFGKNMDIIAENILETNKKAKMLLNRFLDNEITEYRDVEFANELKIFLQGFMTNWQDFVNKIAVCFYDRLKALGDYLSKVENSGNESLEDDEYRLSGNVDFTEYAFNDMVRDFEEETTSYFNMLEESYYLERAKMLRGTTVIFEADQPAQNAGTGTKSKDTKKPKIQVQDNSTDSDNKTVSSSLAKITADIGEFITNIVTKFTSLFKKSDKKYDEKRLKERSYANVQVQVPNYDINFGARELKDPGTIATNIRNLTPQAIQQIPDEKAMYAKIFANTTISGIPFTTSDEWKSAVTKTYLYGSNRVDEARTIANNELKEYITNTALPFCDNISDQISGALTKLGDDVDKHIKSLGGGTENQPTTAQTSQQSQTSNNNNTAGKQNQTNTNANAINNQNDETKTESVSIFMTEETAPNTESSISTKVNWIRGAVKLFSGIILNVLRDIGNDFKAIFKKLAPRVVTRIFGNLFHKNVTDNGQVQEENPNQGQGNAQTT
jgi:hypothetical protein